jgi:carbohydrate-selective porin OprB
MANQAIFRPTAGSNTGLDVHFGMDFAPDQTYNKIDRQLTLGFVYNGPIPKRSKDSVAFGIINSHVSSMYSQAYMLQSLGATHLGSETAYELNYLAQVTPWYMIQPVVQIYQDLGANPRNGTGVVLGFRTKVTF